MDDSNPFEAPKSSSSSPPSRASQPSAPTARLLVGWLLVFLFNLPIPILSGSGLSKGEARIGMALGCLLLAGLGAFVCARSSRLGMALISGGVAVALTQIVPIPQFLAGTIGLAVAASLGFSIPNADPIIAAVLDNWPGGLVATVVTGGLLVLLSLGLGLIFQIFTRSRGTPNSPPSPEHPD